MSAKLPPKKSVSAFISYYWQNDQNHRFVGVNRVVLHLHVVPSKPVNTHLLTWLFLIYYPYLLLWPQHSHFNTGDTAWWRRKHILYMYIYIFCFITLLLLWAGIFKYGNFLQKGWNKTHRDRLTCDVHWFWKYKSWYIVCRSMLQNFFPSSSV